MKSISIWQGNEEKYEANALALQVAVEQDEESTDRCMFGEKVFWHTGPYAVVPGHIYSRDGAVEYRRASGICEFHFDGMFAEEGDLPPRGWQIVQEHRESQKDG